MFQRDLEDSDEDWGIHFEYDDPSNGRHECVVGCRLGSQLLSVELSRPLSQQLPESPGSRWLCSLHQSSGRRYGMVSPESFSGLSRSVSRSRTQR